MSDKWYMLTLIGEKTSRIYLGSFVMTSALTLIMAHTAVAATIYPILVAIYALYTDEKAPTRFGKGLFIGMAFTAGAGSIITLLGAPRAGVAIGFYRQLVGREVDFFELNEAFAAVGIASARQLGISMDVVNVNGGAIALGHPLGCTGAKLCATLLNNMRETGSKYGVESMCVGGGMGAAALFERCP